MTTHPVIGDAKGLPEFPRAVTKEQGLQELSVPNHSGQALCQKRTSDHPYSINPPERFITLSQNEVVGRCFARGCPRPCGRARLE